MEIKKIFDGVYLTKTKKKKILLTKNLVPGQVVYGEKLFKINNIEYREWQPSRSKLAAAILKSIPLLGFNKDSLILYLGAASGTTLSHVSDIASNGMIFAVELAFQQVRNLMLLAKKRKNIAPILANARNIESYNYLPKVDFVYQDIAQRDQAEIFLKNILTFLKKNSYCMIAVKARSISMKEKPSKIYRDVENKLKEHLEIIKTISLEPWQLDHAFFVCKFI